MAIYLQFVSTIIRMDRLDAVYPGGFAAWKKDFNMDSNTNGIYWHDDHLLRIGSMSFDDALYGLKCWVGIGLKPVEVVNGRKVWKDLCLVGQYEKLVMHPCDWIEVNSRSAYLKGVERGNVIGRQPTKFRNLEKFFNEEE